MDSLVFNLWLYDLAWDGGEFQEMYDGGEFKYVPMENPFFTSYML